MFHIDVTSTCYVKRGLEIHVSCFCSHGAWSVDYLGEIMSTCRRCHLPIEDFRINLGLTTCKKHGNKHELRSLLLCMPVQEISKKLNVSVEYVLEQTKAQIKCS